ncbi:poly(A)-specific ribonuclease PNLDC1-like isoform X2 [Acanthaster planci]|uniref:Poly(A)-specific ribonuclease PNLDC1-like isoform X2 n=1 Tax=Acanthaster planci TaxID=133434 RepID=A0A8B7ZHK6_ACAPL|nr:poly(A)-specific ribonuclease PNLDC1-like isoform X2 [Acanthaster planci]
MLCHVCALRKEFQSGHQVTNDLTIMHYDQALDTEFTGLHFHSDSHNSLFDTPQERYSKLRQTASHFTLCQLGLSAFIKAPSENRYCAHTYNFYLFPRSCSTVDARFYCQASSIQFLCQYGFDFNKLFYEGVSYLSMEAEKELRQQCQGQESILTSDVDDYLVTNFTSAISDWLPTAKEGDQLSMTKISDDIVSVQVQALLRDCFPTIWTSQVGTGEILITKVTPEKRAALLADETPWIERLFVKLAGFNKVFRHISELKKPVIGHNFLTDLLFLHSKFYKPLPAKFKDFKRNIHKLFPHLYDTKFLIMEIRKNLEEEGLPLASTSLSRVYRALHTDPRKLGVPHMPDIELAENCARYDQEELFHEAGFDAYLAGYVFLKMAHYIKAKDTSIMHPKLLTFRKYIPALAPYENKTNVIRGSIPYVNIAGEDPASRRPKLLYVTSRGPSPLQAKELATLFNTYTSVDVKMIDKRHALLATSNYGGSKDIMRAFKNDKTIHLAYYNVFQHSKPVRYGLWGAVAVMGAISLWVLLGDQSKRQ